MFLDRVIHFGETLSDQVKGRSPKKLKWLMGVPNLVHLILHVLSFNMTFPSSSERVPRPSFPFQRSFGIQVKGWTPEKPKTVNGGSHGGPHEGPCLKVQ